MKTIGFVGVGELAKYSVTGLRRGGYDGPILLSPRNRRIAAELQRDFACSVQRDNQAVVEHSDCVVIATRPPDCFDALGGLEFRSGQTLISVVAGIQLERLREVVPATVGIVRAMPVSSAEVGASPTLIYPADEFVAQLFDHCGNSIMVDDEAHFDQGTVLACVYSWYFELFQTLIDVTGGEHLPPAASAELVMGMAKGAAELALANRQVEPGAIAAAVATEGTYSRLGLDLLEREGAFEPWRQACELLQAKLTQS